MGTKSSNSVKNWLIEEKLLVKELQKETMNYFFVIQFPDSHHFMQVFQPKNKEDLTVITCETNIDEPHKKAISKLPEKKKNEFLFDLKSALNQMGVVFDLSITEKGLESYMVLDQIYADGLSKDRLLNCINAVFRAKLQGVFEIQKRFGNSNNQKETFTIP